MAQPPQPPQPPTINDVDLRDEVILAGPPLTADQLALVQTPLTQSYRLLCAHYQVEYIEVFEFEQVFENAQQIVYRNRQAALEATQFLQAYQENKMALEYWFAQPGRVVDPNNPDHREMYERLYFQTVIYEYCRVWIGLWWAIKLRSSAAYGNTLRNEMNQLHQDRQAGLNLYSPILQSLVSRRAGIYRSLREISGITERQLLAHITHYDSFRCMNPPNLYHSTCLMKTDFNLDTNQVTTSGVLNTIRARERDLKRALILYARSLATPRTVHRLGEQTVAQMLYGLQVICDRMLSLYLRVNVNLLRPHDLELPTNIQPDRLVPPRPQWPPLPHPLPQVDIQGYPVQTFGLQTLGLQLGPFELEPQTDDEVQEADPNPQLYPHPNPAPDLYAEIQDNPLPGPIQDDPAPGPIGGGRGGRGGRAGRAGRAGRSGRGGRGRGRGRGRGHGGPAPY